MIVWLALLLLATPVAAQDCLSPCTVDVGHPFAVATDHVKAQSYRLLVNGAPVATPMIVRDIWTEFAIGLPVGTHTLRIESVGTEGGTLVSEPGTVIVRSPPVPQPPPGGTTEVRTAKCRIRATATPPDSTGGWRAEFRRGTTRIGSYDSIAPYDQTSGEVSMGSYAVSVRWTKSGQTMRVIDLGSVRCGG